MNDRIAYFYGNGWEFIVSRHAPRCYPWHAHAKHSTVGVLIGGQLLLETRDATANLFPGDFFVVPPRQAHRLHMRDGSSLAVLCVADTFGTGSGLQRIGKLIPRPYREIQKKLADLAVRTAKRKKAGIVADTGPRSPSIEVLQRIAENPEEPFPLAGMAAYAGYSRWHFLRQFRREVGISPHAYQLACRLGLARRLLRKGVPAARAAQAAGFNDQSHMHKVFKTHHGMTPGQFLDASVKLTS